MSQNCLIDEVIKNKIPCRKAKERLNRRGVRGEKINVDVCPWHINSSEHYNCFWIYQLDPNAKRGHQLIEISKLLGTSVNNIKLIETEAFRKLKDKLIHLKNTLNSL